jgi:hypothetical protein
MATTEEPIEQDVQEVRCNETGVPLPAIPAWYANVRVKFISDAVRQRSTPRPSEIPSLETAARRGSGAVAEAAEPVAAIDPDTDEEAETEEDVPELDVDAEADPLETDEE